MNTDNLPTAPGTCFRFTVGSAEQAATVIREKLGENARVLSVRNVSPTGLAGLFSSPKLEVIAQVIAPESAMPASGLPEAVVSTSAGASKSADGRVSLQSSRARFGAPQVSLATLLQRSGFSESMLQRLQESPAWTNLNELPLHRALVETGRHLCELGAARHGRTPLSRAAFLGAPGSGRTTALCKWLAAEVFRHGRLGHVVTAEFDRPNLAGPLPVFCEALGVPLAHYPALTRAATPGGFVYFDLPGISVRHPGDNAALGEFLAREEIGQRVLVLNAAYSRGALRAAYAAGCDLGATHVVFTHLDEVMQWGRLWDYLVEGELEPLFLATGPSLTGDCEENALDAVARRTLPASEPADVAADNEAETESTLNTAA